MGFNRMIDRVLHKRLDRHEGAHHLFGVLVDVNGIIQTFSQAHLLNGEVIAHMLDLFLQSNDIGVFLF